MYVQDEELASPNSQQQQQQHDAVFSHSTPERASSITLGKLSVERQQDLFEQNLPAATRSQMAARIPDQAKSSSDAPSGEPAVLDMSECNVILYLKRTVACAQSGYKVLCNLGP